MPINETMENYNRRNPFVIVCKDLRDLIDQTTFDLVKTGIVNVVLLAGILVLEIMMKIGSIAFDKTAMFNRLIFEFIFVGTAFFCLITVILLGLFIMNCIRTDVMDKVDKVLHAEQSEILNSNNEVLFDVVREMEFHMGMLTCYDSIFRSTRILLVGFYILTIVLGGLGIIL